MRKVIILKGLPASGKSTYAKGLIDKFPSQYKRLNKDDLRAMLDNNRWSKHNEKEVVYLRDMMLGYFLNEGHNVIIDDTNLHPKHEESIRNQVKEMNKRFNTSIRVEVKFFDITPKEAIARDLKRPNSVGSKVIMDMYDNFIKVEKEMEIVEKDYSLPIAIICDLDGTLCIHNGRSPFEYDKCDTDKVNELVRELILDNYKTKEIIFLSGREDSCIDKTRKWLNDNLPFRGYKLFMRKAGDSRKDCIVKKEIFDREVRDKYCIHYVLDDRLQICEMWYKLGLPLLKVGDPNANF